MTLHIEVERLAVTGITLIGNLRVVVAPGQIHTVMGPSGSGKSSLLAAVCGTLDARLRFEGSVTLQGRHLDALPTEARRIGILFQDDLLFPHMNVAVDPLFAVPAGPRPQRNALVAKGLGALEMQHFAHADPATLSGGQRSGIALMRALLAQPQALLLDEPFSRLDKALRACIREFVFALVRTRQIPVLLATHDDADIADPTHVTLLGNATAAQAHA